ncbi:iron-containing alcohol dehydrogenase [Actinomadura madurae]|uniref:1,3-propanediol dehydrogenase n=1 Tax=Actinomadura madurae TaxID=1993 RepID=A0A1I5KPW9_9ACTN|nr:iron-containing alcohol dehydrogenase [Actinomadura madurae]SFO86531.1 1,3-propanediol dehydrogenase [Actinomadura madurae]SPT49923.1 1,3-propanediol dehydrogenase [Actinomadura madurae]
MSLMADLTIVHGEPGTGWRCDAGPCGPPDLAGGRPAAPLTKFHVPEIVFGLGSLAELGHCALRLGGRRPFLVTDPGLMETGWVDEAVGHLRRAGLRPVLWHDVTPNPKDHEVEAGFRRYAESGADVIIGLGGGSCIDAAKGVAILSGNGGRILDYEGVDRVVQPIPPSVMVPSTSGTGADVSQFAVITDTAEHVKLTIVSRTLVPETSLVDPRLLTTMPDWLNAATGLDALTHAVEAFVSRAHNPLSDNHALHAVKLIIDNLTRTHLKPGDVDARVAMAQASLEAGMAFTNAILGATHAMSHQVGGLLDAPHGVVNGVLLPHVIRVNAEARPERFVSLAEAAGIAAQGIPPNEAALRFADRVRALADELGVPKGLASLGVAASDVPRLARTTLKDACMATNPRDLDVHDVQALFSQAL